MAIALYGATGYTGQLVTDELARSDIDFVLGGRSSEKLGRLAEERGRGARRVVASVDDPGSLARLLDGCRVVINCAGPFTLAGEAVVRAAIEAGCHYVDSTGEQAYMQAVFERHGSAAERQGVALVPALGFDYAIGDCVARLTARGREPLERLDVAYAMEGWGMTRGTLRTGLEMLAEGAVVFADGEWRSPPRFARPRRVDFSEPIGRRPVTSYPAGEVVTVPRHTDVRNVSTWIATDEFVPHRALAPVLALALPALSMLLREPVRRAAGRLIDRLPEGPAEDDRRATRFTVVATAEGGDGSVGRGVARGHDVYGLTAALLARCAASMASGSYDRSGALGPAAAFDAEGLLSGLADRGVSFEIEGRSGVRAEPLPRL